MLTLMLFSGLASADELPGRAVYVSRCQACHGAQGAGDGPAARALPKKPRDMTAADFWSGMTDARLTSVITNGRPGSAMRAYKLKPDQLKDLLAYLNTFKPSP